MASGAAAKASVIEMPHRDPFDFPVNTGSVDYMGVKYEFRELTVNEIDVAREMATDEKAGTFDGRFMTRIMVTQAATEPKMDLEVLQKLPQRLYNAIVDCVNELNDPDALKAKDEDPGKS